jgi:hypothetical protein
MPVLARNYSFRHPKKKQPVYIYIAAGVLLLWFLISGPLSPNRSLVPAEVRKAVQFSVYYPKPNNLPRGFTLNEKTFKLADDGVVVFSVTYGNSQDIVFSEQAKPADEVIEQFIGSTIPVHNQVNTLRGQATIGVSNYGSQQKTIISLPINNGPWLIVTAPADINQDNLRQILQELTK